jgi:hypothetical protein
MPSRQNQYLVKGYKKLKQTPPCSSIKCVVCKGENITIKIHQ